MGVCNGKEQLYRDDPTCKTEERKAEQSADWLDKKDAPQEEC